MQRKTLPTNVSGHALHDSRSVDGVPPEHSGMVLLMQKWGEERLCLSLGKASRWLDFVLLVGVELLAIF